MPDRWSKWIEKPSRRQLCGLIGLYVDVYHVRDRNRPERYNRAEGVLRRGFRPGRVRIPGAGLPPGWIIRIRYRIDGQEYDTFQHIKEKEDA